jgi:N-acetylmuramoyl-L-alanine amidase
MLRRTSLLALAACLAAPATAAAATPHLVREGDTLWSIAVSHNLTTRSVAAYNGLAEDAHVVLGTTIMVPTVAEAAPQRVSSDRVTSDDILAVAAHHGVPGSLAAAIAWQESGFNNTMVSSTNARGVMQVMPGTWDWVQANLATRPLDPSSATDNLHAGILYLRQMLHETGGDQAMAAAAYYQGLASVRQYGLLAETRRYVANVMALTARF